MKKIICPVCHKSNPADSMFCRCCGSKLEDPDPSEEKGTGKKPFHHYSMAVVLIAACAAMLVLGFILYPDRSQKAWSGTYVKDSTVLTVDKDGAVELQTEEAAYTGNANTVINMDEAVSVEVSDESGSPLLISFAFHEDSAELFIKTGTYTADRIVLTKSE